MPTDAEVEDFKKRADRVVAQIAPALDDTGDVCLAAIMHHLQLLLVDAVRQRQFEVVFQVSAAMKALFIALKEGVKIMNATPDNGRQAGPDTDTTGEDPSRH